MKLSYNWLKNYLNFDESPEKISEILTDGGLEVEGLEKVESVKGGLNGLVIGEVLTCEKHPNADRLSVTTVDVGSNKILPIVCGAPNVAAGQKVVVATVGTELYTEDDSFTIQKSKIRGEISEGMICAEDEIGLGKSHDGIMVLPDESPVGLSASEYFKVESDYVFEIGLTPNRADATSHIGAARDLVALLNHHFNKEHKLIIPQVNDFQIDNHDLPIEIEVKNTEACPRYSGLSLSGVEVKDSPDWLQNRLKAVGIRPINNIVDITNFVLMETGQALHAFDYDKITSKKVVIQELAGGIPFTTLDEVERKLSDKDLMICNGNEPMCLAGIFGGLHSGVTEETKNIFLESAYFNPVNIRKSAKHHGLNTDASFRFERGADPNITVYALKRAVQLFKELANAKVSSQIIDLYPTPINPWTIDINVEQVQKLAGVSIDAQIMKNILCDLDFKIIEANNYTIQIEIPTNKVDVKREVDIIEEILRVYGFNQIPIGNQLKSSLSFRQKPDREFLTHQASDFLVDKGFYEAMNNSLTKAEYYSKYGYKTENNIPILNPLSGELNALRQDLVFGLLESLKRNINHKNTDIKLFEFGKHYSINDNKEIKVSKVKEKSHLSLLACGNSTNENWKHKSASIDFYFVKSIVHALFNRLGIPMQELKPSEVKHEGVYSQALVYKNRAGQIIMSIGKLTRTILKDFDLSQDVFYADIDWDLVISLSSEGKISMSEISKFPAVRRDLALLVNKDITFSEIEDIVFKTGGNLVQSCSLFDVYEGKGIEDGKKSYAISCILQNKENTLTDKIIDKTMNKIQNTLERNLDAQLR